MPDGTSRFSCDGQPVYHYMGCSTFSEYTVVLEISIAKIQKLAPLSRVCLLGCGITTGFGAATTLKMFPDATVAIFGLGGVGVSVVQGARVSGAKRIIGIDANPSKFALATKFGCTECIDPTTLSTSIQEHIVEITNGGVDYSFECIGNVNVMRSALESTHKGWGVSTIIGVAPSGSEIKTEPFQLVTGRTWRGSAFGGIKGRSELPGIVQMYMDGKLSVDEYVTFEMPLEKINEAFQLMIDGKSIRTVILFDQ